MKNPIIPERAASAQNPLPPVPTTKILAISHFISMPFEQRHLRAIRDELDQAHAQRVALVVSRPTASVIQKGRK